MLFCLINNDKLRIVTFYIFYNFFLVQTKKTDFLLDFAEHESINFNFLFYFIENAAVNIVRTTILVYRALLLR